MATGLSRLRRERRGARRHAISRKDVRKQGGAPLEAPLTPYLSHLLASIRDAAVDRFSPSENIMRVPNGRL